MSSQRTPLDDIFDPRTIAVIGATEREGSVGRDVFVAATNPEFKGKVFPINPKSPTIFGHPAFTSIKLVPEKVDLAVIVTPAGTVPGLVQECADAGVKGVVIITAGFKEVGPVGKALEDQITAIIKKHGMRVIGPNCLGIMTPPLGVNASFGKMALKGSVAFLSQSGALGTAMLDWTLQEGVGFSSFVSIGSMMDVDFGDLIEYYGRDEHTKSICIYMESIGNAASFLKAASAVSKKKPIVVIKAGRTDAAAKAAASHTGALTGSDDVLDAAFKRAGVLRVIDIQEFFQTIGVLAKQPLPQGNKLTLITNAGGPGVLTTDALVTAAGTLAPVSQEAKDQLNTFLPSAWSHGNPVDILGDARADRFAKTLEVMMKDPASDGVLVLLTMQSVTEPTKTAELLTQYAHLGNKPVLASWMGGGSVLEGRELLKKAGIPVFDYPDTAVRVFGLLNKQRELQQKLVASDHADGVEKGIDRAEAKKIIAQVQKAGRTLMTEFEAKELMASYGIPVCITKIAKSADEAGAQAEKMGFPVVVKLFSETITHKSDVGGVVLNVKSAQAAKEAYATILKNVTEKKGKEHFQGVTVQQMIAIEGYEIILGCSPDPQFGPVLLFGQGGQLVEVMKDKSLGLPPLTPNLAGLMLEETKIYKALKGVRGRKPVDIEELKRIMVRFSLLAAENPVIKEIDINPLIAGADGIVGLDARVVLYGAAEKQPKAAAL
jgi:acetyltransferase